MASNKNTKEFIATNTVGIKDEYGLFKVNFKTEDIYGVVIEILKNYQRRKR